LALLLSQASEAIIANQRKRILKRKQTSPSPEKLIKKVAGSAKKAVKYPVKTFPGLTCFWHSRTRIRKPLYTNYLHKPLIINRPLSG
jgi:hypothetical protein